MLCRVFSQETVGASAPGGLGRSVRRQFENLRQAMEESQRRASHFSFDAFGIISGARPTKNSQIHQPPHFFRRDNSRV